MKVDTAVYSEALIFFQNKTRHIPEYIFSSKFEQFLRKQDLGMWTEHSCVL
jgi:hypothetical protein